MEALVNIGRRAIDDIDFNDLTMEVSKLTGHALCSMRSSASGLVRCFQGFTCDSCYGAARANDGLS